MEALTFCKRLDLAGFQDWRLPAIDELCGIYEGYAIKGGITISGTRVWSSSARGEGVGQYSFAAGFSGTAASTQAASMRALCVRTATVK
jgi:hypothetical protein